MGGFESSRPEEPAVAAGRDEARRAGRLSDAAAVLCGVLAIVLLVAAVMADEAAHALVYGRLWFHLVLALAGAGLVACVSVSLGSLRKALWSVPVHGGLLVALIGALMSLASREQGSLVLRRGVAADEFIAATSEGPEARPLGWSLRLVDVVAGTGPAAGPLGARPVDCRAEVELSQVSGAAERREISVNHPLRARGSTVLLAGCAGERGFEVVTFAVTRDGGEGVFLAGWLIASAGLIMRFYLLPALERLRRSALAAGGA